MDKTHHRPSVVKALIITILLLGIVFRFTHIGKKNYWHDEVYTSLRVAGYTYHQAQHTLMTNQLIGIEDLQRYQRQSEEHGLRNVMSSLLQEEPHIPPLYFVITRLWTDIWGLTPLQTRTVAAIISLLALPGMYWLGYELFQSSAMAWVATLLVATSPLHILYAQEARNYSLLTVSVLLSSAALLRALRISSPFAWMAYAATAAIALYSHMLSILVLLGHGLYVWAIYGWRQGKLFRSYILAMLCSFACFLPWVLASQEIEEPGYVSTSIPLLALITRSLFNLSVSFFDVQVFSGGPIFDSKFGNDSMRLNVLEPAFYLLIVFTLLSIYSVYFLLRHSPKRVYTFIVILIAVNILPLLLPDLIASGQRFTVTRYLIPALLGIQLAVAYTFSIKILSKEATYWKKRIFQAGAAFLIFCSVSSSLISMRAETWWTKYSSYDDPQIAQVINNTNIPIVASSNLARLTALSYLLNPEVKFILFSEGLPNIPNSLGNVFVYWPEKDFLDYVKQHHGAIELTHKLGQLWKLNT